MKGERGRIFLNYEPLKDLPVAVVSSGSFIQNGKIYIVSGDEKTLVTGGALSDKMYVYDIATDTWTESLQKFARRNGHRAHYYKGKVFIVGGKYLSTNRRLEYTAPHNEIYELHRDTLKVDSVNHHHPETPTTFY